jgi:hypothetical protein
MNRRSVLGFLGLAPSLGGVVANELSGNRLGVQTASDVSYSSMPQAITKEQMVDSYRTNLSNLIKNKDTRLNDIFVREFNNLKSYPRVDVDILALKSFSDVAKIELQAKRNAQRNFEDEKDHLQRSIESLLDSVGWS